MKTTLTLSIFFAFLSFSLSAQSGLTLSQDTAVAIYSNVDLSDQFEFYPVEVFIGNSSEDTLVINWTRVIHPNCPDNWQFFVSDINNDYIYFVEESLQPLEIVQQEPMSVLRVHVRPKGVPGCCDISMILSDHLNPEIKLDTAFFHIRINDDDCLPTSIEDITKENIEVFPNPAQDYFSVLSFDNFDRIELVSFTGKTFQFFRKDDNHYDISQLSGGLYLLNFIKDENILSSQKIIKQ